MKKLRVLFLSILPTLRQNIHPKETEAHACYTELCSASVCGSSKASTTQGLKGSDEQGLHIHSVNNDSAASKEQI